MKPMTGGETKPARVERWRGEVPISDFTTVKFSRVGGVLRESTGRHPVGIEFSRTISRLGIDPRCWDLRWWL